MRVERKRGLDQPIRPLSEAILENPMVLKPTDSPAEFMRYARRVALEQRVLGYAVSVQAA